MEIPLRGCLRDANPFGVFLQADCAVIGLDLRAGLERNSTSNSTGSGSEASGSGARLRVES